MWHYTILFTLLLGHCEFKSQSIHSHQTPGDLEDVFGPGPWMGMMPLHFPLLSRTNGQLLEPVCTYINERRYIQLQFDVAEAAV